MFVLKIENEIGEILRLSQNESRYQILDVDGLYPTNAQINRSSVAGADGSIYNSSKLEERAITLTIKINGDVESNRIALYRFFNTKKKCKMYVKNGSRDVFIEGWVENHSVPQFVQSEIAQITIVCPNPYFKSISKTITNMSNKIGLFEFPFAFGGEGATNPSAIFEGTDDAIEFSVFESGRIVNVRNESESETGMIMIFDFLGSVSELMITNTDTEDTMRFVYSFVDGDRLTINTNVGEKSIVLTRNAVNHNLFTALQSGATFLQLEVGDNYFGYLADNGENNSKVKVSFEHRTVYGGV